MTGDSGEDDPKKWLAARMSDDFIERTTLARLAAIKRLRLQGLLKPDPPEITDAPPCMYAHSGIYAEDGKISVVCIPTNQFSSKADECFGPLWVRADLGPTMPPEMPEAVEQHVKDLWQSNPGRCVELAEIYAAIREALKEVKHDG